MARMQRLATLMLVGLAPTALAAASVAPVARVKAGSVTYQGKPSPTVHVPKSATYVGSERFTLYDVADAEVHVFVEADAARQVQRLYWIQFESYLPSKPELQYNYADGNVRKMLWGTPTWLRTGPASATGPTRAGSDREHVTGILTRAGYTVPAEVMNVRLVQLLDDPQGSGRGRRELMLIYSENLAPTGATLAQLAADGPTGGRWKAIERDLVDRATKAYSVTTK